MNRKKNVLILYVVLSLLLLANLIADGKFQISIAGYWSDRVLFWLWFFSTFYILFAFWKKLLAKIYFVILLAGLILSMLPMLVPFFAIILSSTGNGLLLKKQINEQYRVQIVGYGIMARPFIEVIQNKGILEKRIAKINRGIDINKNTYLEVWEFKDVRFISETDSTITVQFSNDKLSGKMIIVKNDKK